MAHESGQQPEEAAGQVVSAQAGTQPPPSAEQEAAAPPDSDAGEQEATATPPQQPLCVLSDDRMTLNLRGPVSTDPLAPLLARVDTELAAMNASQHRRQTVRERLTELSARLPVLEDMVLLKGTAPEPPIDGRIEWLGNFFARGFVEDKEKGTVDYRRKAAESSVNEGQRLARLIPPKPGVDGLDAIGRVIAAAKPQAARVRVGRNIAFDDAEQTYYATASGRVRIQNGHLQVDDVYTVEGSVGLETGHVDHPGTLVVQKNIDAGSEVSARGDVFVQGYIENAVVEAGGSITVRGGISGQSNCILRAGGGIAAKFVQNAGLFADGDIIIEREIDNADINSRGTVFVSQGRIAGGQVTALGGVEAKHLGTTLGAQTFIEAGADYALDERLAAIEHRLESLRELLKRTRGQAEPVLARHPRLEALPENARQAMQLLIKRIEETEELVSQIEAQREELIADSAARRRPCALATDAVFPEVSFRIADEQFRVRERVRGPLAIINRNHKIRLMSVTAPTLKKAWDLLTRKKDEEAAQGDGGEADDVAESGESAPGAAESAAPPTTPEAEAS